MHTTRCLSCRVLAGEQEVPGGVIYEDSFWIVASKTAPVFFAGNLFVILKRHCEQLADLTPEEAASLGPMIRRVCAALSSALHPAKIYVASYGEDVKHIHFHVIPRIFGMPAGSGAVFLFQRWKALLYRLGVKGEACSDEQILQVVVAVRQYMTDGWEGEAK